MCLRPSHPLAEQEATARLGLLSFFFPESRSLHSFRSSQRRRQARRPKPEGPAPPAPERRGAWIIQLTVPFRNNGPVAGIPARGWELQPLAALEGRSSERHPLVRLAAPQSLVGAESVRRPECPDRSLAALLRLRVFTPLRSSTAAD